MLDRVITNTWRDDHAPAPTRLWRTTDAHLLQHQRTHTWVLEARIRDEWWPGFVAHLPAWLNRTEVSRHLQVPLQRIPAAWFA